MTTYFLSYARADETIALRLASDLIAAGVSVWVDQYDILPSQHWDRAVESAVRSCGGMIIVLSPRSVASPNVADEISVAIDDGKAMIPVLIEPCTLPLRMTRMNYIDATRDYPGALRRCLAAVAGSRTPIAIEPASGAGPAAAPVLPRHVLDEAERRLAGFIGPIAKVLVRAAAVRASAQEDLYRDLARSLPTEAEQSSFLGWLKQGSSREAASAAQDSAPNGSVETVPDEAIRAITIALARHMGPIAPQLVARERRLAAGREELCRRLSLRIAGEKERLAFLAEVAAK